MKVISCFVFILLHSGISSAKPTEDVVETGKEGSVLSSVVETVNRKPPSNMRGLLIPNRKYFWQTDSASNKLERPGWPSPWSRFQRNPGPGGSNKFQTLGSGPRFSGEQDAKTAAAFEIAEVAGRRSPKEKNPLKKLLPLLLFLRLKLNALIPMFLAVLAFISVKALIIGKLAFFITTIGMFKNLLTAKKPMIPPTTSYEVVSEAYSHDRPYPPSNTPTWGRTYDDGDKLAYSNYAINQN